MSTHTWYKVFVLKSFMSTNSLLRVISKHLIQELKAFLGENGWREPLLQVVVGIIGKGDLGEKQLAITLLLLLLFCCCLPFLLWGAYRSLAKSSYLVYLIPKIIDPSLLPRQQIDIIYSGPWIIRPHPSYIAGAGAGGLIIFSSIDP